MATSSSGASSKPRTPEAARGAHVPLSHASDAELGQALIDAVPDAFQVAWQRFLPLVRHMVRRALGQAADADDLVQEIFFALFRGARTLRSPLVLRAYVMVIAARTLRNEQRRRRKWAHLPLETEEQIAALRISADPATKHAFLSLEQLVGRLRERERLALMLRFVHGMGVDEVAEALGVSAPTARRSFSRALERLRAWANRDPFLVEYLQKEGAPDSGRTEPTDGSEPWD